MLLFDPRDTPDSLRCWRALRRVAMGLGFRPTYLWFDDLVQAAMLRLHEAAEPRRDRWPLIARSAMLDEYVRLRGPATIKMQPWAPRKGLMGPDCPVQWFAEDSAHALPWPGSGPDGALHARQVVQQLDARWPGWLEALETGDTLACAAARMGVTESRACQVRGEIRRRAAALL